MEGYEDVSSRSKIDQCRCIEVHLIIAPVHISILMSDAKPSTPFGLSIDIKETAARCDAMWDQHGLISCSKSHF